MKRLLRPLTKERTYEQVYNHYQVEKQLAEELRNSTMEQRRELYKTLYARLFKLVPDHPRLVSITSRTTLCDHKLIKEHLPEGGTFVEIGPGDCKLAVEVAAYAKKVYTLDVQNQNTQSVIPPNYECIIYDGFYYDNGINGINGKADIVFADQLLEHIHPDDVLKHFIIAKQLLSPEGKYIFMTPHASSGPHDISAIFSRIPEGLHLKEWTYSEVIVELAKAGFKIERAYWYGKGIQIRMPILYFRVVERLLKSLSFRPRRYLGWRLIPSIRVVAVKKDIGGI